MYLSMNLLYVLLFGFCYSGALQHTRCALWNANSSSSVGATARCGLCPVEQYLSIFPYLSQTLSIFSLPALEDLFLLLHSILSWVFLFVSSLPVEDQYKFSIISRSVLLRMNNISDKICRENRKYAFYVQ